MARKPADLPVTLSVLDRLIADEMPVTRADSLRQHKAALRRDLENLLNSRRPVESPPAGASELPHSLLYYGLPDICSLSLRSQHDQAQLARLVEQAVRDYEPRLSGVKVTLEGERDVGGLRFAIEGMLRIDPAPERVSFDANVDVGSGNYQVRGEKR